jgi:Cytochrome c554 and c-prime
MVDPASRRSGNGTLPMLAGTVILLLLAGGAVYVLLNRAEDDAKDEPQAADVIRPLFEGWEEPAAVLVLTGEQHGYLEPCGCTERQTGGLRRRADLFRQLREERGWSVAGFDLGGALNPDRVVREQERIKFETTRAALRDMDYAGMAWGPEELRLTAGTLFDIAVNAEGGTSPEFICANVALFGERGIVEVPRESVVIPVGMMQVGVTAVVGESVWKRLGLSTDQIDYAYEPPAAALERVLSEMASADDPPDVLVLLSHCDVDESRELAGQFPQFNIIVTAGGPEDGRLEPEPIGDAWMIQVGRKGKHVGVVGVYPDDPSTKFRFELVDVDRDRFQQSPEIQELMRAYQQRLEQEYAGLQETEFPAPNGAHYVGAESCSECHTRAYAVWIQTRHALNSYESLGRGREGETDWIPRIHDPECLCCHTTGWDPQRAERYESGFVDESTTPHLKGQQCENCHGAGSRHVELEQAVRAGGPVSDEVVSARQELQITKDRARTNLCVNCHDLDNSPTFDTDEKPFDTYWWPKVQHVGKD